MWLSLFDVWVDFFVLYIFEEYCIYIDLGSIYKIIVEVFIMVLFDYYKQF